MNNATVVLATVIFALVGTLVIAAVVPYLSHVEGTVLIKKCPKGDRNPDRPGCGPGGPPIKTKP